MECRIRDLSIYYEEYGEGKPVLCLHGFPEDHKCMSESLEPIFQKIDGYRRIYLDLPGMGNTKSTQWIKNADDMLDILKAFINNIIGDQSFLLVGCSFIWGIFITWIII